MADVDPGVGEQPLHLQREYLLSQYKRRDALRRHAPARAEPPDHCDIGRSCRRPFVQERIHGAQQPPRGPHRVRLSAPPRAGGAPRRGVGPSLHLSGRRHHPRVFIQAAGVRLAVSFDQPLVGQQLDRQGGVLRHHSLNRSPARHGSATIRGCSAASGVASRAVRRSCTAGGSRRSCRSGCDAGRSRQPVQQTNQARSAFHRDTEPERQQSKNFLHARMHEIGHCDDLFAHFPLQSGPRAMAGFSARQPG